MGMARRRTSLSHTLSLSLFSHSLTLSREWVLPPLSGERTRELATRRDLYEWIWSLFFSFLFFSFPFLLSVLPFSVDAAYADLCACFSLLRSAFKCRGALHAVLYCMCQSCISEYASTVLYIRTCHFPLVRFKNVNIPWISASSIAGSNCAVPEYACPVAGILRLPQSSSTCQLNAQAPLRIVTELMARV